MSWNASLRNVAGLAALLALTVGVPTDAPAGRVIPGPSYDAPRLVWSPDGTRLVLEGLRGAASLVMVDVATGETRPLTQGAAVRNFDAWSPDGRRMAVTRVDRGDYTPWIDIIEVSDGATRTYGRGSSARWSPDGNWLAYLLEREDPRRDPAIVVARIDGSEARVVGHGRNPSWHPMGKLLAFERRGFGIEVVGIDEPGRGQFATSGERYSPRWSPDGLMLAYWDRWARVSVIARLDGSVVRAGIRGSPLHWAPDSRTLATATVATTAAGAPVAAVLLVNVATGRTTRLAQQVVSLTADWLRAGAVIGAGHNYGIYLSELGGQEPWRRLQFTQCSGYTPPCLEGGGDGDRVVGGSARDVIFPGAGDDVVLAHAGDDRVDAAFGADTVYGGAGHDVLLGQADDDRLLGGPGMDSLDGGGGEDLLDGGSGDDVINAFGDGSRDTIRCGRGKDVVHAGLFDRVATDCERVSRSR